MQIGRVPARQNALVIPCHLRSITATCVFEYSQSSAIPVSSQTLSLCSCMAPTCSSGIALRDLAFAAKHFNTSTILIDFCCGHDEFLFMGKICCLKFHRIHQSIAADNQFASVISVCAIVTKRKKPCGRS